MKRIAANNAFSRLSVTVFSALIGLAACSSPDEPEEPHAVEIVSSILKTRDALQKEHCSDGCIFLTFWDFDGTILKGDCSEGLRQDGKIVYRGLVELTIEQGFSSVFRRDEARKFEEEYRRRDRELGHRNAYTFLTTQYGGADPEEITAFAKKRFELYQNYYFRSSIQIWKALEEAQIQNHIISASPHFFVQGAAESLGISGERINGVRLQQRKGQLLPTLDPPLTYADGKTETLQSIVKRLQEENPSKQVFVLAAFGNSYHTDGHFLEFVHSAELPAGKTLSVMINGGESPEEYNDRFLEVTQNRTLGDE
ncbi:MAG: HAD family hydrolase [Leptospiraceae bacterium]